MPKKSLPFLANGLGKEEPHKTKLLDNKNPTPVKGYGRKLQPYPHQQRLSGQPTLPASPSYNLNPRVESRRSSRETGYFKPTSHPIPPQQCHWRETTWEQDVSLHPYWFGHWGLVEPGLPPGPIVMRSLPTQTHPRMSVEAMWGAIMTYFFPSQQGGISGGLMGSCNSHPCPAVLRTPAPTEANNKTRLPTLNSQPFLHQSNVRGGLHKQKI